MDLLVTQLSERVELVPQMGGARWDGAWPEFMDHDPIADLYYGDTSRWRDHIVVATEGPDVVAKGYTIPFAFPAERRTELPDGGWDQVIRWGADDHAGGVTPTTCSALEITVLPTHRGRGISRLMVAAMRDMAASHGYADLYAPVRPSRKSTEPHLPMKEYLELRREDGLPVDPWLRVHVRLGGEIVRPCPTSMTVTGTLAEWRSWTGLPFDSSGTVVVPDALVPVHVDVVHDHAVYVEPNVWVRHRLGSGDAG